nr:uncharacterized protein LOC109150699 isoform X5 [Ipomoea batatas]
MARSNGSRRSKNRVSGRSFWSASSGSAGSVAHSGHGGPFKRRHTPVSFYPTPAGIATRVSARRCAVRRWSNRGNATLQPVVISDCEGETDDEFHTAPGHPTRVPRMGIGGTNPGIKMRGGPNELVRLVSSLTTSQRQDVSSIGMGGLLGLEVTEMPPQLGHWLVTNFEPAMIAIKLGNGRYINITAQDIAHVFGLPNEPLPITERDSPQVGPELRAWREEAKQRKGKITVKALVTVSNGYANQKTVHMFRDVEQIKDLDWCTYLLRSLVDTHGRWSQGGTRKFTGPLLFLTLLYVDRVVVGPRDVPRTIPPLEGWTSDLLKAREAREITAQGFGVGHLEDPPHATTDQAPPSEPPLSDQGFTQLLDTTTRDLLCAAARVADMVRENCAQAYGDHNFKRVNEASKLLLELSAHIVLKMIDHVANPGERSGALLLGAPQKQQSEDDMPSFSLGFTQDYSTQGNEDPIPLATLPFGECTLGSYHCERHKTKNRRSYQSSAFQTAKANRQLVSLSDIERGGERLSGGGRCLVYCAKCPRKIKEMGDAFSPLHLHSHYCMYHHYNFVAYGAKLPFTGLQPYLHTAGRYRSANDRHPG